MKFLWAQTLGKTECPYLKRWVADFSLFSVRLHHWFSSDDHRYFHDHPWWYVSLVLKGGYTDVSPSGEITRKAGSISFFEAMHRHTVRVAQGGCWSVLLTGPEKRIWGFWVNGKFKKRNRYFYDFGHHPCEYEK